MAVSTSHTMVNVPEGNTTEAVKWWACEVCLAEIVYSREGYGTPFASKTEFPEDIDSSLGECPGPPAQATITRRAFLDRVTEPEISAVLNCACETMPQQCLKAKMFKLQLDTTTNPLAEIVPDDVQSLVDHMVTCGMIDQTRADEILDW